MLVAAGRCSPLSTCCCLQHTPSALQNAGTPLNEIDLAATALCAFFIAFEAVADQQQWAFQVRAAMHVQQARVRLPVAPTHSCGACRPALL